MARIVAAAKRKALAAIAHGSVGPYMTWDAGSRRFISKMAA
jgi:hypothetical protein